MERANLKTTANMLLRKQRVKRIASEIHLLEQMDWRLWKLGLVCFWASFVAVVGGVFATVTYLGQSSDLSYFTTFVVSLCCVSILYWMLRYPIWTFALLGYLVVALIIGAIFDDIPTEVVPDLGFPSEGGDSLVSDRKEILRRRVQYAILKRRKLLNKLNG
jgi:hypothetical protein